MMEYQPNRIGEGTSKHVVRNVIYWGIATAIFGWLMYELLLFYPRLSPGDPYVVLRSVIEKTIKMVGALSAITGTVLFYDWKTNGNLFGRMLQDPRACAYFLGALILAGALLAVWL